MNCYRKITEDLYWVGGNDRRLALFENMFPIPKGVSYNSYLLTDEKTVLFDAADRAIADVFFANIAAVLNGRPLDYLVVNHLEPDHGALIKELYDRYPDMKIVGNVKTFMFMNQFHEGIDPNRLVEVKEGQSFSTGRHEFKFVMAPMVHWPEAMMTFDATEGILFSADAFGSFGSLDGNIFNDEIDFDREWLPEARRYYTNIVGKYGMQVQSVLRKASSLDINMICPLHGPVWRTDLGYIIDKYMHWSKYEPEEKGAVIAYASMYGNTESCANRLAVMLADAGVKNIKVYDVSHTHVSTLVAETFRYSHLVVAAPTYNNNIYHIMHAFLHDLKALDVQNRTVGIIGNGTWAPASPRLMTEMVQQLKNIRLLEPTVVIKSSPKDAQVEQLEALKDAIVADMNA